MAMHSPSWSRQSCYYDPWCTLHTQGTLVRCNALHPHCLHLVIFTMLELGLVHPPYRANYLPWLHYPSNISPTGQPSKTIKDGYLSFAQEWETKFMASMVVALVERMPLGSQYKVLKLQCWPKMVAHSWVSCMCWKPYKTIVVAHKLSKGSKDGSDDLGPPRSQLDAKHTRYYDLTLHRSQTTCYNLPLNYIHLTVGHINHPHIQGSASR